jgi:hypothetical protein
MQHKDERTQTSTSVHVVGIIPDRWKVAGKFNIAGPVKELTARAAEPNKPIEPAFSQMMIKKRE